MSLDQPQAEALSEKAIRRLFRDWTSLKALGCHPLAHLDIVNKRQRVAGYTDTATGQGLALREVLQAALDSLKPNAGPPEPEQKSWRPYIILDEQYVHGRNPDWVMEQLHISKGTYYTEQKRALALLADVLHKWEEEHHGLTSGSADERASEHGPNHVPFLVPPRPAHKLIGRDDLLGELKQRLLNRDNRTLTALNGLPGVGKSALAIELAHDPEILSRFHDGVLWAGLGRQPDMLAVLGTWATALGISVEVVANCTRLADRAAAIHAAIGLRRMLLIIDDAWTIEAALAFKVGGPNCAHLVTSRLANVALDFAGDKVTVVRELNRAQGLSLLAQLSPRVVEAEPEAAQALVQSVGGLPLALILMGSYLRKQSYSAQTRRLREAMTELQAAEVRLQLTQPQSLLEKSSTPATDTPLSLQVAIGFSQASLDNTAHQALLDLSLFPPKPNTFSEASALAVIAAPVGTLDTLVDHGLVESLAPDRYTIHQTIADWASLQGASSAAIERLVHYFVDYVETYTFQHEALEREINNILMSLEIAANAKLNDMLIRGANAFHPYLETRGLYQVDQLYLRQAYLAAESDGDNIGLAMTSCCLGDLYVKLGQLKEAQASFQQSIALTHATGSRQVEAYALLGLGLACEYLGGKAEDRNYFERAWCLFQELGDKFNQGYALNGLGQAYVQQGDFKQAAAYLEQALAVCRESRNRRGEGWAHYNLGTVELPLGNFTQAKTQWLQCLSIYREINERRGEGWLIYNLGRFHHRLGQYDHARAMNEQARQIFLEIGDRFGQGFATHNLGLIASEMGDEAAVILFEQSLQLFFQVGCGSGEYQIYHSLGVWCRRRGDFAQARTYLERAVKFRREMSYMRAEGKSLAHLGLVYHYLGERQLALECCQQALQIAQKIGTRPNQAHALTCLGHILTGLGRLDEAAAAYRQAVALHRELGQPHLVVDPQAGLASVFFAQGNLSQAQNQVEEILAYLVERPSTAGAGYRWTGVDNPRLVFLTCYRVLQANHDSRAQGMTPPRQIAFAQF